MNEGADCFSEDGARARLPGTWPAPSTAWTGSRAWPGRPRRVRLQLVGQDSALPSRLGSITLNAAQKHMETSCFATPKFP